MISSDCTYLPPPLDECAGGEGRLENFKKVFKGGGWKNFKNNMEVAYRGSELSF